MSESLHERLPNSDAPVKRKQGPPLVTPDEGPSLETSKFSLYFSGSCIPTNENFLIRLALPTLAHTVQVSYKG